MGNTPKISAPCTFAVSCSGPSTASFLSFVLKYREKLLSAFFQAGSALPSARNSAGRLDKDPITGWSVGRGIDLVSWACDVGGLAL